MGIRDQSLYYLKNVIEQINLAASGLNLNAAKIKINHSVRDDKERNS